LVVTLGAVLTVNVAAVVATLLPQELLKSARYWFVLREALGLVIVSVPVVTPLYGAIFERFVKGPPPVLTCH